MRRGAKLINLTKEGLEKILLVAITNASVSKTEAMVRDDGVVFLDRFDDRIIETHVDWFGNVSYR